MYIFFSHKKDMYLKVPSHFHIFESVSNQGSEFNLLMDTGRGQILNI